MTAKTVTQMDPVTKLDVFVRARYPVIWIVSAEEERIEYAIQGLMDTPKHQGKTLFSWTIARGMRLVKSPDQEMAPGDPIQALQFVSQFKDPQATADKPTRAVFLFKDLDPYLKDPRCQRALRDVIADITSSHKTVILLGSSPNVPESCKRQVAMINWDLPTLDELGDLLDEFIQDLPDVIPCDLENGDRDQIARALSGLSWFQAQSVLSTAAIATGKLDADVVQFVNQEKARVIKESGILEFYNPEGLPEIGGLDLLKQYLTRRRRSFTARAREYGVPTPKGMLLLGVPGGGKSLTAKTIAKMWGLPLIRLDVGAVMGSHVGESERNMRQALQVAESTAPCVLWLDEIEKGLSGVGSSGNTDGGTTARVFGTLLTWLQEKTAPVYVVATSNDISALPPELLRAGRFDEIFFVDVPNPAERAEIWSIHLGKVNRDPASFDLDALVSASEGYTGAEIETAVGDALVTGFDQDQDLDTDLVVDAITSRVPLTETMRDKLDHLRGWAKKRARPASSEFVSDAAAAPSRSRRRTAALDA